MAKVIKAAAMIVGAVALAATGIGSLGIGAALGMSQTALATVAVVAKVATIGASLLSIAAGLTAKKPTAQATGSPTQFSADPDAGIPLVLGRTGTAGNIVFRKAWDTRDAGDNDRQAFVSVLSLGPVAGIDTFTSDKSPVSFSAGAAIGAFAGFMWMTTQLGAIPEASALSFGNGAGTPPGWTAQHKLSGKAAATWTLKFDTKGKVFQAGVPAPMWVVRGVKAYDPRKDSTYPGGSGAHRMADPSDTAAYDAAMDTWEFTEDPYLLGLRWAHGFWQRDRNDASSKYQRVMGMGAPWATIDVPAFVEGANIARANGWTCGSVIYSGDDKWASMKKILQAGMGEPLQLGARISCLVNAPKVSLATLTKDDLAGKASVAATQPRRDRINTITPRYRLEENYWQLLPGAPISVPEFVTLDRGKRSKVQDYPLIQNTKQVATAVRYDIENAREFGPISLPLKLVWMGYKPGDCVTVTLPEVGLNAQPVLLLNRELDPATAVVTMTARSETAAKHPYALGQTTTPPPTPGVTGPLLVPVPGDGDWFLDVLAAGDGVVTPTLVVLGHVFPNVDGVVFEYREFGSEVEWTNAGSDVPSVTRREITGVKADTQYEVAVSYVRNGMGGGRRIIGPVTTPTVSVKGDPGAPGTPGDPGAPGADAINNINLVPFSRMEQGARGWDTYAESGVTVTSLATGDYRGSRYVKAEFAASGAGKTFSVRQADPYRFSVIGIERIAVQIGVEGIGSLSAVKPVVWFYDASGVGMSNVPVAAFGGAIDYNTPARAFITPPTGAVTAMLELYGTSGGAGTMALSLTLPMVTVAAADQTEFPAFAPGMVYGADGLPGSPGAPGAPGRDAVVFQQNATPTNPVVGDTWVTVNLPRVWKRWNGTSWVQILGDVAALSIIDSAYIADLAVGTAKIANLSVGTIKVADGAITSSGSASQTAPVMDNGSFRTLCSYTISLTSPATVFAFGSAVASSNPGVFRACILRINADGATASASNKYVNGLETMVTSASVNLAAGSHTFVLEWTGPGSNPWPTVDQGVLFIQATYK